MHKQISRSIAVTRNFAVPHIRKLSLVWYIWWYIPSLVLYSQLFGCPYSCRVQPISSGIAWQDFSDILMELKVFGLRSVWRVVFLRLLSATATRMEPLHTKQLHFKITIWDCWRSTSVKFQNGNRSWDSQNWDSICDFIVSVSCVFMNWTSFIICARAF